MLNKFYHVSDFSELFMMSFKYGLFSSRYSYFISITIISIFDITFTIKIAKSHWFLIIFFLLFKKVCSIFDYSVLDYFIFFFFSFKRFLKSLIMLPSDCFSNIWFPWFLSTTTNTVHKRWFTIIFGYICLKKIHNFVFNTTHCFLWTWEYS